MSRVFRFVDPENGRQIRAEWTTPGDFTITRLTPGICGKRKHNMEPVLCVTQWGIDRQRDIAVYQCKRCKRMWAFKMVTFDAGILTAESGLETDVPGGLNDIEHLAQETDNTTVNVR